MENLELALNITSIVCLVVVIVSGMYVTHLIYEDKPPSFFEMWFLGFYMSLHLIPLLFYNFYGNKAGIKQPLWVFRASIVLLLALTFIRTRMGLT